MSDSPIRLGTHSNGKRYARAYISGDGFSVTVEGTGSDDDAATARLACSLRKLAEMCEDLATELAMPEVELREPQR